MHTTPLALLPLLLAPTGEGADAPRPGADSIGDPYYPGLGAGGYDAQHYDLVIDVDLESGAIDAVATITAVAEHALSSFHLDFHGLRITSLEVNARPADFARDGRELEVLPAAPLPAGEVFTTRVAYRGVPTPVPEPAGYGFPVGWHHLDSGIFVTSQCTGAASWFPCNDHQLDRATFSFTVTVAKPYVVAANGELLAEHDLGKERTYVWHAEHPMAPYLATLGIAEFRVEVDETPSGLPLRSYFAATLPEEALEDFALQGEILDFFESTLGPYPFDTAGAIVADEMLGGALETQTRPVYGHGTFGDEIIAHELAHMWFGDAITAHHWRDMWLNEGFATYASHLWVEYAHGFEAAERQASARYRSLRQAEVGPPFDPGVRQLFSARVYERGAWVLHALRLEVGDDVFFEILQAWVERKTGEPATTEEFVALCDEVAGRDLAPLFAGVLYAPVIPEDPRYE